MWRVELEVNQYKKVGIVNKVLSRKYLIKYNTKRMIHGVWQHCVGGSTVSFKRD